MKSDRGLARHRNEYPVKVEWREGCHRRQPFQRQFIVEVGLDVVDGAIDPPFVLAPMRCDRHVAF